MNDKIIQETYTITDQFRRFDFRDDRRVVFAEVSEDGKHITFGYRKLGEAK